MIYGLIDQHPRGVVRSKKETTQWNFWNVTN